MVHPISSSDHFLYYGGLIRGKKTKVWYILWHETVWSIWLLRNKIIFQHESFDMIYLLDFIKVQSFGYKLIFLQSICFFQIGSPIQCPVSIRLHPLKPSLKFSPLLYGLRASMHFHSIYGVSMVESFLCLERNYTCWTFLKSGMFPWRLPFFCYFFYILDEGILLFDCLLQQGFLMYAFVFALESCLCWCWFVWSASLFFVSLWELM